MGPVVCMGYLSDASARLLIASMLLQDCPWLLPEPSTHVFPMMQALHVVLAQCLALRGVLKVLVHALQRHDSTECQQQLQQKSTWWHLL